jgi:hypothetical protein
MFSHISYNKIKILFIFLIVSKGAILNLQGFKGSK